jgi:hypothetical protein
MAGGPVDSQGGGGGGASPAEAGESDGAGLNPLATLVRFRLSFWMLTVSCLAVYGCVLPFNNVASSLLMERTYFRDVTAGCTLASPNECQSKTNPPAAACAAGRSPGGSYAPPLPVNVTIDGKAYAPLTVADVRCSDKAWSAEGACTHTFCEAQTAAEVEATRVMSIPYMISAVSSPFLGLAVDRFGLRAVIAVLCAAILILAHLALGFYTQMGPTLPLVGQGVAFSVFAAALWPSVPYTVPESAEGLAFGLVTALQNGGLGLFPVLISWVYGNAGDKYIPSVEIVFLVFGITGFAAGVSLNLYDATHGHTLNRVHLKENNGSGEEEVEAGAGAEGEGATVAPLKYSEAGGEAPPTPAV